MSMTLDFEIGKTYTAVETFIRDFGGQQQGGIAPQAKYLLFFYSRVSPQTIWREVRKCSGDAPAIR
jgi:hypothetical protein